MRHQKKGKKAKRLTKQRKALFKGLLNSLFLHGEIKTTLSKAKLTKRMADGLISKARERSLSVRREILAFLQNKSIVDKLISEIAPASKKRIGGFTKILRIGRRRGDDAPIAKVQLIEKESGKEINKKKGEKTRGKE